MAGIKALRKIQFGVETTAGTAVAATDIWRGLGTLEDQRTVEFVPEDVGIMQRTERVNTPKLAAEMVWDQTAVTFEELPIILEAGVKAVWTAATADSGSGKVYAYTFPTTTANTLSTFTIEGGDNQQAEEMEYAHVRSFELSGKAGESWKVTATWMGRQASLCSFSTSGVTVPTVEDALFSKTTLYIDTAGSIGTTSKSQTLLGATLNVSSTGVIPVFAADGQLYFSFTRQTPATATLALTYLHNTTAVAEVAAWRAKTPRAIRLLTTGNALTTTGTTHTTKKLIIDCWGVYEKISKIGEEEGNDIVTATMRLAYSVSAAKFCDITIVNELANLGAL